MTTEIISCFENEQKSVVFSALSEYLSTGLFVDISLVCKGQVLRAHKVVLSSSSKYFRDFFRHQPTIAIIDLDKELAENDLNLTLEDVQLIIGILYCVGTVEISPQRIETLLVCSQVLGIPTLISFLKRIRESINDNKIGKDRSGLLEDRSGHLDDRCEPVDPLLDYHDLGAGKVLGPPTARDLSKLLGPSRYTASTVVVPTPAARRSIVVPTPATRRSSGDMMYLLSPTGQPFASTTVFPPQPSSSILPPSSSILPSQVDKPLRPVFHAEAEFPLLDLSLVKPLTASCMNSPEPPGPANQPSPIPTSSTPSPVPGPSGARGTMISRPSSGISGGVKDSLLYQAKKQTNRQLASRVSSSSFSSFSLNCLQSPRLKSTEPSDHQTGTRITSMLDGIDTNLLMHLNNLQANQLDDLENVLLPHLTSDRTQDLQGSQTSILDLQTSQASILDLQGMETGSSGSSPGYGRDQDSPAPPGGWTPRSATPGNSPASHQTRLRDKPCNPVTPDDPSRVQEQPHNLIKKVKSQQASRIARGPRRMSTSAARPVEDIVEGERSASVPAHIVLEDRRSASVPAHIVLEDRRSDSVPVLRNQFFPPMPPRNRSLLQPSAEPASCPRSLLQPSAEPPLKKARIYPTLTDGGSSPAVRLTPHSRLCSETAPTPPVRLTPMGSITLSPLANLLAPLQRPVESRYIEPRSPLEKPCNFEGQSRIFETQVSDHKANPCNLEDQSRILEGHPCNLEDQPRILEGQPHVIEDQPHILEDQPRIIDGQALILEGQTRNLEGPQFLDDQTLAEVEENELDGVGVDPQPDSLNTTVDDQDEDYDQMHSTVLVDDEDIAHQDQTDPHVEVEDQNLAEEADLVDSADPAETAAPVVEEAVQGIEAAPEEESSPGEEAAHWEEAVPEKEEEQHPSEIIMNLDQVCQTGQKMKFSIPGVSQAVTLNFSAEALQEMKNAALRINNENAALRIDNENAVLRINNENATLRISNEDAAQRTDNENSTLGINSDNAALHFGNENAEVRINNENEALRVNDNAALQINSSDFVEDQNSEITSSKIPTTVSDSDTETSQKVVKKPRKMKKNLRQKLKSNLASGKPAPSLASGSTEKFTCVVCKKSFTSEVQLKKHNKFHVEKSFPCPECHEILDKRWLLDKHLETVHSVKEKHECPDCSKVFFQRTELMAHLQAFHQSHKSFTCRVCGLEFSGKHHLVKHLSTWHGSLPAATCATCAEVFEDEPARDNHVCPGAEVTNRSIICHQHPDPVQLTGRKELTEHMLNHHAGAHDNFQVSCCICQKTFLLKKNLWRHLRNIHKLETWGNVRRREFPCTVCRKSFYYKNDLINHLEGHSSEKKYKCEKCGRMFYSVKSLKQHERNEYETNPTCDLCNKRLSSKAKLRAHMLTHSEDRPFPCKYCSIRFKEKRNMQLHVKTQHSEKLSAQQRNKSQRNKTQESKSNFKRLDIEEMSQEQPDNPTVSPGQMNMTADQQTVNLEQLAVDLEQKVVNIEQQAVDLENQDAQNEFLPISRSFVATVISGSNMAAGSVWIRSVPFEYSTEIPFDGLGSPVPGVEPSTHTDHQDHQDHQASAPDSTDYEYQ